MKEKILLIGGGGHCHSVIDVIEQENRFDIMGIIDKKELVGKTVLGYNIIGSDEDLPNFFYKTQNAFITIGHIKSNEKRISLYHSLKTIGYKLPSLISPLAYVSKYSNIGEGTIIMHQALVNANAKVGNNCIINTKALIEHDAIIENHCHISTGSIINGGVIIKENSFIGSNTTTKEYIQSSGFVKAGSVIKC